MTNPVTFGQEIPVIVTYLLNLYASPEYAACYGACPQEKTGSPETGGSIWRMTGLRALLAIK
jgi:hypothetical protein